LIKRVYTAIAMTVDAVMITIVALATITGSAGKEEEAKANGGHRAMLKGLNGFGPFIGEDANKIAPGRGIAANVRKGGGSIKSQDAHPQIQQWISNIRRGTLKEL
jgi:hypothetical protein